VAAATRLGTSSTIASERWSRGSQLGHGTLSGPGGAGAAGGGAAAGGACGTMAEGDRAVAVGGADGGCGAASGGGCHAVGSGRGGEAAGGGVGAAMGAVRGAAVGAAGTSQTSGGGGAAVAGELATSKPFTSWVGWGGLGGGGEAAGGSPAAVGGCHGPVGGSHAPVDAPASITGSVVAGGACADPAAGWAGSARVSIGCQDLPSHHQSPSGDRSGPGGASMSGAIFA
jgi:type IV secretion system protein TrbL